MRRLRLHALLRRPERRAPASGGAEARALLDRWRRDLDAALGGRFTDHLLWPAFCRVVERYAFPRGTSTR